MSSNPEYMKNWRANNRDKIIDYQIKNRSKRAEMERIRRKEDPEKIKKRDRERYYRNREKRKKQSKDYYYRNREKRKKHQREYYKNNRITILENSKVYNKNNSDKIKVYAKSYRKNNHKDIITKNNIYSRRKRKEDKEFNIKCRLKSIVNHAFANFTKTGKTYSSSKYGIDYKAIIEHLKPFPEDLSKYHIDHIRALCTFHFINADGSTNFEEIKKAFDPSNLRWLLAEENIKKSVEDKKMSINCKK
jgi:hypothetical protein